MSLQLDAILDAPLAPGTKALPKPGQPITVRGISKKGWNVLRGDLPMPVAVLKASALSNNIAVMADYLSAAGIKLAPHGKTTLCPQLFDRQLAGGAWGITVATVSQLSLCHDIGVERVLMANELVGDAEVAYFAELCAEQPDREYYVLVDSMEGAHQIQRGFSQNLRAPPARVLIEIGMSGGRCGVRTSPEAFEIAKAISTFDRVRLCGIEGYEGLIVTSDAVTDSKAVSDYLNAVIASFQQMRAQHLFADESNILLSAGGSVYYDLVSQLFMSEAGTGITPIVRAGCYLTHDSGFYRRLLAELNARKTLGPGPRLLPALEVWTRVLSRPEPGLAILSAGKRDLSFDIDLPEPQFWCRTGDTTPVKVTGWRIERLSDQHAFLRIPDGAWLAIGDLVGLGISHPCTTFDKWSLLLEVNDGYDVVGGLKTFF